MSRKNYRVDEVIRSLSQKNDVKILGGTIYILTDNSKLKKFDLGNGSWGKIDYLVNHCGYVVISVLSFPNRF